MPKIIKDLKPHIKTQAMKLFQEVGYEKLSMRKLASAVGIAVGTLYNYFPNKEALFHEILIESWQSTITAVNHILKAPYSLEQIRETLEILYTDMEDRQGLGKYIIQLNPLEHNDTADPFMQMFQTLMDKYYQVFTSLNISFPDRKSKMLVINTVLLNKNFKDEKEENMAFLMHLIKE